MSQTITIGDTTYRLVPEVESDIKIVILQRGHVFVGRFRRDGDMCELTEASQIRHWGATKGLGEIAAGGPTSKTVLDPCGRLTFHILTVVAAIDCDPEGWSL